MAHIGGFAAGLILAPLFARGRQTAMSRSRRLRSLELEDPAAIPLPPSTSG